MSLANAVAQMAMQGKEAETKAMDEMINMVKMERLKRLGRRFMDQGDFSPQGILNFSKAENVQIDEMQTIVQLVGEFQKLQKTGATPNRFSESERGILNQQSGEFVPHDPKAAVPSSPFAKLLKDRELYPESSQERAHIDAQIAKQNELASGGQPSSFGKLLEEMNALPEGDPHRAMYQQKLSKEMAETGMSISVDKDGNVQVLTNADQSKPQGEGLQKTVAAKVQTDVLDLNNQLGRILQIEKEFKPEYQKLENRLGFATTAWGEKLGMDTSPEDEAALKDFSEYKRKAISNINQYIKYITGAQMSESEAQRVLKGMPNPGFGIFDGDSQTEFKSKMRGVTSELKRAVMRANYVNRNGLKSFEEIPLGSVDGLIEKRGTELEAELKAKGLKGNELKSKIKEQLKDEFGMVF